MRMSTENSIAMVLDWREMSMLRSNYCQQHFHEETKEDAEDLFDDLLLDQEIIRSTPTENHNTCDIMVLEDGDCFSDIEFCQIQSEKWQQCDEAYALLADHQMSGQNIFNGSPYRNVNELVSEFKEKVGGYLPADFDYEGHIGFLTYSATC